jgi:hypothetical protein
MSGRLTNHQRRAGETKPIAFSPKSEPNVSIGRFYASGKDDSLLGHCSDILKAKDYRTGLRPAYEAHRGLANRCQEKNSMYR